MTLFPGLSRLAVDDPTCPGLPWMTRSFRSPDHPITRSPDRDGFDCISVPPCLRGDFFGCGFRRLLCGALFLLLFAFPSHAADTKVSDVAHAADEHYNNLKTFKADFTEIYQGPGISRNESGTLWLKKPGRMRWEYRQPREKLFLTDSHTAFFYVPGERQARKTAIKNLDDIRSPLRYLLGKTKLEKELEGLSLAPDITPIMAGDTVIRGVPKDMKDRISFVVLEITPAHQITRIVIQEVDGTTTEFRFSNMEENVPVQDSLFRFTPPPGVEVIEQSQIAP